MKLMVHYRDQCAYKKEGNADDTYCFKTEGATHTTECLDTGEDISQSGALQCQWSQIHLEDHGVADASSFMP